MESATGKSPLLEESGSRLLGQSFHSPVDFRDKSPLPFPSAYPQKVTGDIYLHLWKFNFWKLQVPQYNALGCGWSVAGWKWCLHDASV